MGLDICAANRHPDDETINTDAPTAQWSYGGFHAFRQRLAFAEGFDLEAMAGFGDPAGRPWSEVSTTLAPLLNHSDCDGKLTPAECSAILPRLKEIRLVWAAEDTEPWDVEHLDSLIDLVTYCATMGVNADFH